MVAYFCPHPARKIKSTCELILLAYSKIMLKCNLPMWTSDLVMLTFNMLTRNIKHKFVFQWIMLQINLNKTHIMIFMTHVHKVDKICQYASNCVAIYPVECKLIQFDTQQNYVTMIKLHVSIPFTHLEIIHFPWRAKVYDAKFPVFYIQDKYLKMRFDYVDMRGTVFMLKYDLSTLMILL